MLGGRRAVHGRQLLQEASVGRECKGVGHLQARRRLRLAQRQEVTRHQASSGLHGGLWALSGRAPTELYLNFETRSACSRITRALSSASVPVGSPLYVTLGL